MANRGQIAAASRAALRGALVAVVLAIFVAGFAVITIARRIGAALDAWLPRSATAPRSSSPGAAEIDGVLRGLLLFADAVAEDVLVSFSRRQPR